MHVESHTRSAYALAWVTACVVTTVIAFGAYGIGQQTGRITVDDVPRALAHRAADALARGAEPASLVAAAARDLATDPVPFVVVFDADHRVLATDVTVAGEPPNLPSGVLDAAADSGEDHVTWQPLAGVREAVFAQKWQSPAGSGVVVAGASLAPSEQRSRALLDTAAVAWFVMLAGLTAGFAWFARRRLPRAG